MLEKSVTFSKNSDWCLLKQIFNIDKQNFHTFLDINLLHQHIYFYINLGLFFPLCRDFILS